MTLNDMAKALSLDSLTPTLPPDASAELSGGYVSDLLSDALANAPSDGVLVTVQVHMNVLAVAVHTELAAVIFASGRTPERAVIEKAIEERIPLYRSNESAFDVVGKLYAKGLRGPHA